MAKWEAVHRIYPEEAGASRTLTELMTYMQTWVGAVNTTVDTGQGTRHVHARFINTEFPIPSCREVFRKSFRKFPCTAWAVASCSTGPQAGGTP